MKLLLLQHVKKIGNKGDIVEVADGYAVNSLLPQKKAVQATAKILNDHKMKQKSDKQKQEQLKSDTIAMVKGLAGKRLEIKEKLNSKGSLYHALGAKEMIKAIADQYKVKASEDLFKEKYAIKDAGEHQITLKAYGVEESFTLVIQEK